MNTDLENEIKSFDEHINKYRDEDFDIADELWAKARQIARKLYEKCEDLPMLHIGCDEDSIMFHWENKRVKLVVTICDEFDDILYYYRVYIDNIEYKSGNLPNEKIIDWIIDLIKKYW